MTKPGAAAEGTGPVPGTFGAQLRARRRAAGLSQEGLAEAAGVATRTVANLEKGRVRRPHAQSVQALGVALGLTGPDLLVFRQAAGGGPTAPGGPTGSVRSGYPWQLPAAIEDFTGHRAEARAITRHLTAPGTAGPRIAAVSGPGGIGKTTLALHTAHALAGQFPDGQLFVNLGGSQQPLPASDVLDRFLRALGVDGSAVPAGEADRAAMYRSLLAGRRILVVLDNAVSEHQVRPLLPGGRQSAVLVTSRRQLTGLESAGHFQPGTFGFGTSLEFLTRLAPAAGLATGTADAASIVTACGGLPLAVRIAGTRLAALPAGSIGSLARQLADEHRRLDQLRSGDLEVRASVGLGYAALSATERRAFRMLSVIRLESFSAWVLAPLLSISTDLAQQLAERLAEHRLLEIAGTDPAGEVRYRFHDLVRLYAAERAAGEDSEASRRGARERALAHWLVFAETLAGCLPATSDAAVQPAVPGRPDGGTGGAGGWAGAISASPAAWYRWERANLVAAVRTAAAAGYGQLAWRIANAALSPSVLYADPDVLGELHAAVLEASRASGDRHGEAVAWAISSRYRHARHDFAAAASEMQTARDLFGDLGDQHGVAYATIHTVQPLRCLAEQAEVPWPEVARWALQGAALARACGSAGLQVDAAQQLGELYLATGELGLADHQFSRAIDLSDQLGKPAGRSHGLHGRARIAARRDDLAGARRLLAAALDITREIEDDCGVAFLTCAMADLAIAAQDHASAARLITAALPALRSMGLHSKHDQMAELLAGLPGP